MISSNNENFYNDSNLLFMKHEFWMWFFHAFVSSKITFSIVLFPQIFFYGIMNHNCLRGVRYYHLCFFYFYFQGKERAIIKYKVDDMWKDNCNSSFHYIKVKQNKNKKYIYIVQYIWIPECCPLNLVKGEKKGFGHKYHSCLLATACWNQNYPQLSLILQLR